jgi:HAD superfamily hydrolase (TIGR01662 family)
MAAQMGARRFIRAVIFDLGHTLMYSPQAWEPVYARADQALAESLRAQGIDLAISEFTVEFRARLHAYYAERSQSLYETTYFSVVRELLEEKGFSHLPQRVIRTALDALFAITQSNWLLESDALPTLRALEACGYRLGLLSNAGDDQDVHQMVERFGIEPYFDFILTSAGCSYRKPHPRIFQLALAHWGFPPSEVAMVGDTLAADIEGAQRLGLYAIWISRRAQPTVEELNRIHPDATVASLAEIPPLLNHLSR